MAAVAALGVASIFAVYTFIGPFVTDVAGLGARWIPIALALFGVAQGYGLLSAAWAGFALTLAGLVLFLLLSRKPIDGSRSRVLYPL
jgi:predicted MFS family arabinose efflux permease